MNDMSSSLLVMKNESNNRTDQSCIILVCVFDPCEGDSYIKLLDMPNCQYQAQHRIFLLPAVINPQKVWISVNAKDAHSDVVLMCLM